MSQSSRIRFFSFILSLLVITIAPAAFAGNTIADGSIKWGDVTSRSRLLMAAPKWNDDVMRNMLDVYRNPVRYQLPLIKNEQQYNVQFINAFWGPLANPFTKYARPAKVFVIFDKAFFMAPLIQNLADDNYYIFTKNNPHPVLLNDWITNLRTVHNYYGEIRFNICNGYGNHPGDACSESGYQLETADTNSSKWKSSRDSEVLPEKIPSAHREVNEDWIMNVSRSRHESRGASDASIYDSRVAWDDDIAKFPLLRTVVRWPSFRIIQENFEKIRDMRYFSESNKPDFLRRISWLYPDDGCWTRASAVIKDFFGPFNNVVNQFPRPSKVFVFGNLCVNSSNHPGGMVTWWYHTAPVVKDPQTNLIYVIDPSINPRQPLTLEKWLAAMNPQSGACARDHVQKKAMYIAICNGYGANPNNKCNAGFATEANNTAEQISFQRKERARQLQLGRDADAVLGKQPPWL